MSTPTVHVVTHENGTVTCGVSDNGCHLTITAGEGATPALLRLAFNAIRPELMPGRHA